MSRRHAIDLALDLARMPSLARAPVAPPIPADIVELMRIAAASPLACQAAAANTGESVPALIEAARFYLQQTLFRPDADCYRVLGIEPSSSRATARDHMRWLLQWLHPDRNNTWDAVYAERVLKAWREVSTADGTPPPPKNVARTASTKSRRRRTGNAPVRLPWIPYPVGRPRASLRGPYRAFVVLAVPTGLLIMALMIWSAVYYFGTEHTAAIGLLQ